MPTQRFGLIGLDLFHASLAQSVEHAAVNRRVVGSSPTGGAMRGLPPAMTASRFFKSIGHGYGPLAQLVRAAGS